jgi:probable phosphoglycerate mutase
MTHIFLVRHGTNDFVGKCLAGRNMDVHLNKTGLEQAHSAAEWLLDKKIGTIISSPITRAVETAIPLAERLKLPIIENDLIQEVDYGDWAGASFDQLKNDKKWKAAIRDPEKMKFPNGETTEKITARLLTFISSLQDAFTDDDVVACFSHNDIIAMLIVHMMKWQLPTYRQFSIKPASISAVSLTSNFRIIHFLNLSTSESFQFPMDVKKSKQEASGT